YQRALQGMVESVDQELRNRSFREVSGSCGLRFTHRRPISLVDAGSGHNPGPPPWPTWFGHCELGGSNLSRYRDPMALAQVLVVDDEPSILTTLKTALTLEGYAVDVAGGVALAAERTQKKAYDVIL